MKIYILYNDFEFSIERVSCDSELIIGYRKAFNGETDGHEHYGPYATIEMEIEHITKDWLREAQLENWHIEIRTAYWKNKF